VSPGLGRALTGRRPRADQGEQPGDQRHRASRTRGVGRPSPRVPNRVVRATGQEEPQVMATDPRFAPIPPPVSRAVVGRSEPAEWPQKSWSARRRWSNGPVGVQFGQAF